MRAPELALCLAVLAASAPADGLSLVPYSPLKQRLDGHLRFDALPYRAEPGHRLDQLYPAPGVTLGSHFQGQSLGTRTGPTGQAHDALISSAAQAPLTLRPGPPGQSLSVAWHRGFGSMALFALGPAGFPRTEARGEGAVSLFFELDQGLIGLRVHSGYADPLGRAPRPGALHVVCLTRDGAATARIDIPLATGVTEIGLRVDGPPIAGCTLTNTDPGGIAIDDVLYQLHLLSG